jgi:hypothetical protein
MKRVSPDSHRSQFLIRDFDPRLVRIRIKFRLDLETCLRACEKIRCV